MLESLSARLCEPGGVHYGSPDKAPAARLADDAARGRTQRSVHHRHPDRHRRDARRAHRGALRHPRPASPYGHIQEVIVQNFRAKPGTKRAGAAEPDLDDLLWTIAVARLILGPAMNIQAPPNLSPGVYPRLIAAGINDWGGVSPVTPDHVNPEAPWPAIAALAQRTADAGKLLVHRLPIYPAYVARSWRPGSRRRSPRSAPSQRRRGLRARRRLGAGRESRPAHASPVHARAVDPAIERIIERAQAGARLDEPEIVRLFAARGADYERVVAAADALRRATSGDVIRYVVNRNINYTNVCSYRCGFCAFSKGKTHEALRGAPYDLALDEIVRRATEAWERGATEVCMQGGIHPDYTGETYLAICRAIKAAVPDMHIHAFSPLEITQGAATLGMPIRSFLAKLKDAGLARCRAPRPRFSTTRCARSSARTSSTRRNGSMSWEPRMSSASERPRRSCSAMSSSPCPGRGISWRCGICRRRPAASPNSCRCPSCIWKRRCISRARRGAGPPSGRRC